MSTLALSSVPSSGARSMPIEEKRLRIRAGSDVPKPRMRTGEEKLVEASWRPASLWSGTVLFFASFFMHSLKHFGSVPAPDFWNPSLRRVCKSVARLEDWCSSGSNSRSEDPRSFFCNESRIGVKTRPFKTGTAFFGMSEMRIVPSRSASLKWVPWLSPRF